VEIRASCRIQRREFPQYRVMTKKATARVGELAKLLRKYKDAYYNATPLVSDAAYDALEDELRELAPDHELLHTVGAPTVVTAWEKAGTGRRPPRRRRRGSAAGACWCRYR